MNALASDVKLSPNKMPDHLLASDRIMLRWAASVGDGSNSDPAWQELLRCRVPQLPWDVAIVVDQLIMRAHPVVHRKIVAIWYRWSDPREVIAEEIGLREDEVYIVHECALSYFRRFFETSPNRQLREMSAISVRDRASWVRDSLTLRSELTD